MAIDVLKTYKIFVGGKFPRTESGRYFPIKNSAGKLLANVCLSSRKDFKNAVAEARMAQNLWRAKSCLNRGQILYRIAEIFADINYLSFFFFLYMASILWVTKNPPKILTAAKTIAKKP